MSDEDFEVIYGPAAPRSKYQRGKTIRFYDAGTRREIMGEILWVCAPNEIGGRRLTERYIVDTPAFPFIVWPAEIIHE